MTSGAVLVIISVEVEVGVGLKVDKTNELVVSDEDEEVGVVEEEESVTICNEIVVGGEIGVLIEVEVEVDVVRIVVEVTITEEEVEVGRIIEVSELEVEVASLLFTGIAVGPEVGCTLVLLLAVEVLVGSPNTIEEKKETGFGNVTTI